MELLGSHELAHVFANLTDLADMARVRAVCREWRDIMDPPRVNGAPLADVLRLAPNKILEVACCANSLNLANSLDLAKYAVSRGATNINDGLNSACSGGHKELVELMLSHGATDFWVLYIACRHGHKEIVELMISRGATDFNPGLYAACEGGRAEMVDFMINHGADDFDEALIIACLSGRIEIAELMIHHGATNFDRGLQVACEEGHAEIAKLIGTRVPTDVCDHCHRFGAEHV